MVREGAPAPRNGKKKAHLQIHVARGHAQSVHFTPSVYWRVSLIGAEGPGLNKLPPPQTLLRAQVLVSTGPKMSGELQEILRAHEEPCRQLRLGSQRRWRGVESATCSSAPKGSADGRDPRQGITTHLTMATRCGLTSWQHEHGERNGC